MRSGEGTNVAYTVLCRLMCRAWTHTCTRTHRCEFLCPNLSCYFLPSISPLVLTAFLSSLNLHSLSTLNAFHSLLITVSFSFPPNYYRQSSSIHLHITFLKLLPKSCTAFPSLDDIQLSLSARSTFVGPTNIRMKIGFLLNTYTCFFAKQLSSEVFYRLRTHCFS